ncbi:SCO family protein [Gemmobacter serpentinus]|uniref:SCO family protein n=1 Tax=Gemmobacter serpentinus TaxID=2652247 RepID=UPI00124C0467|nr:SCO family protein [Gemmobacter serpentinus]
MTGLRAGLLIAGLAMLAMGLAGLGFWAMGPEARQALIPEEVGQGAYMLQSTAGQDFTEDSLKGQPSLVFFGFTHCPDVCPTTLGDIALWQDMLGDRAAALRVFFITVDPARDTAARLADYTGWLTGVQGVTGSQAETDRAITAFRAFARKVPMEGGDYTMDHSASVLVFDARGRFTGTIPYQSAPEVAVAKIIEALQ